MFKIVAEGNPTQLDMSRDVLDLAIKVTQTIVDDFEGSDFWEITTYKQDVVENLLEILK